MKLPTGKQDARQRTDALADGQAPLGGASRGRASTWCSGTMGAVRYGMSTSTRALRVQRTSSSRQQHPDFLKQSASQIVPGTRRHLDRLVRAV